MPCRIRIAASTASGRTSEQASRGALEPENKRWAKVYEKPLEDAEGDSKINLSDFEMDFSETGR